MASSGSSNARLPILLVAPQPFYTDRGTPIAVRQVLRALSSLGLEVDVITFPMGRDVELPGVRILRCANPLGIREVPVGFSLRKVVLDISLAVLMRKQMRTRRYAYLHAVEEAAILAILFRLQRGVPVLYDMQSSLPEQLQNHRLFGSSPFQRLLEALERNLLHGAKVTVASWGLRERVVQTAPNTPVREWVFSYSFEEPDAEEVSRVRKELRIDRGDRLVLYSGTFEPYQGLSNLVAAMAKVLAALPNTVMALIGGDESRSRELTRQAERLGVACRLRILPRQPKDRLPVFLAAADALVSPRAYGGNLPLKVFEYLGTGRPLVVTDMAGANRLLTADIAELVRPDVDSIAEGLIRVLSDQGRSAEMGRRAKVFAQEHLGWERFVKSIEELVRTMTDGPDASDKRYAFLSK